MAARTPNKKDVMLKLLESSGVFIHLDPRRDGVAVPNWFRQKPELVLQVGLNLVVPIPDLEVDDEGVFCTLSFSRTPFYCRLPWHAIFALRSDDDGRGLVWPEDAPKESPLSRGSAAAGAAGAKPPERPKRPKLRAVGDDEAAEAALASADAAEAAEAEPEAPAFDGTCGECGVRWSAGQTSCPVCGAGTDAFLAEGASEPADATVAERAAEPEGATQPEQAGPTGAAAATEPPAEEIAREPASPPPAGDEPKPKRELPPYLRVVK